MQDDRWTSPGRSREFVRASLVADLIFIVVLLPLFVWIMLRRVGAVDWTDIGKFAVFGLVFELCVALVAVPIMLMVRGAPAARDFNAQRGRPLGLVAIIGVFTLIGLAGYGESLRLLSRVSRDIWAADIGSDPWWRAVDHDGFKLALVPAGIVALAFVQVGWDRFYAWRRHREAAKRAKPLSLGG